MVLELEKFSYIVYWNFVVVREKEILLWYWKRKNLVVVVFCLSTDFALKIKITYVERSEITLRGIISNATHISSIKFSNLNEASQES